eukprot:scaffold12249_cov66-Skeletonema_marinoi.AAC.1
MGRRTVLPNPLGDSSTNGIVSDLFKLQRSVPFIQKNGPRVSMICKSAAKQKHIQEPFLMKQDLFIHLA